VSVFMMYLQQWRHLDPAPTAPSSTWYPPRVAAQKAGISVGPMLRPSALKKHRKPHHWSRARPPRHQALPDYRCRAASARRWRIMRAIPLASPSLSSVDAAAHRQVVDVQSLRSGPPGSRGPPVALQRGDPTGPQRPCGFAQYHGSGSQQSLNTLASGPPAFPFAT
jgi:hypothetical protein